MTIAELRNALSAAAELARTSDDPATVDAALDNVEKLQRDIARAERIENLSKPTPKSTPAIKPVAPAMDVDTWVKNVALNPEAVRNAQTTFGNETTGADGGFAAPAEYTRTINQLMQGPQSILGLCDSITTTANSIVLPVDESTYWAAAGIQEDDVAEGDAITASKPVIKQLTITMAKSGVLVPVSEELLADGVGIAGYIAGKSADRLVHRMNKAAMAAFLASGAKVTVTKTALAGAGSAPDIDNVLGLYESVPAEFRDGAVWFANPRLQKTMMKYVIGQTPVFVPGSSLANAPYDMLLGHRVIWSNLCAVVGTAGDLVFVSPKQFFAVTKGSINSQVSQHLYFDQELVAFRASSRFAVKSKWAATIVAPDSSVYGTVAVLETRA